jgi:hypothetical protein
MSVAAKSSILSCQSLSYLSCHRAGASDLPHSRHEALDRDVINPQKGHILCDAKPGAAGVIDANSFETVAVMEATRLRKRSRNRRRARSIKRSTFILSPHVDMGSRFGASGRSALEGALRSSPIPDLRQDDDDMPALVILCKIAHTARKYRHRIAGTGQSLLGNPL